MCFEVCGQLACHTLHDASLHLSGCAGVGRGLYKCASGGGWLAGLPAVVKQEQILGGFAVTWLGP